MKYSTKNTRVKVNIVSKSNIDLRLGRLIDRLTFVEIILIILTIIFVCATSYYLLNLYHEKCIIPTGIEDDSISYWDTIHFSIVTITSLG